MSDYPRLLSDHDLTYAVVRFRFWKWDTRRIAVALGVKEHVVYNSLARWRSKAYRTRRAAA
jgi:hypothetical protein